MEVHKSLLHLVQTQKYVSGWLSKPCTKILKSLIGFPLVVRVTDHNTLIWLLSDFFCILLISRNKIIMSSFYDFVSLRVFISSLSFNSFSMFHFSQTCNCKVVGPFCPYMLCFSVHILLVYLLYKVISYTSHTLLPPSHAQKLYMSKRM